MQEPLVQTLLETQCMVRYHSLKYDQDFDLKSETFTNLMPFLTIQAFL